MSEMLAELVAYPPHAHFDHYDNKDINVVEAQAARVGPRPAKNGKGKGGSAGTGGILWYRRGSRARQTGMTVIILMGMMFACLDTSIVSTALVSISKDLGNDYVDAPWTVLAYLLTYMSFVVGFCKLSDVYGRAWLLIAAWILFSAGSIWCALAPTMTHLIAARALQGIGGSGMYSLAQICLIEQGPNRPEIIGILIGVTLSVAYVLGPVLGGLISNTSWRGIFWLNVPFGAVAIIGIKLLWNKNRLPMGGAVTIKQFDFIGNVFLLAATLLTILALQEGGSLVWAWDGAAVISCLVFGGLSWAALIVWEIYVLTGPNRPNMVLPLFPRLLMGRVFVAASVVMFMTGFTFIALVIEVPQRLQIINNESALVAGARLLPMLGGCALGSFVAGGVNKKRNVAGPTLMVGMAVQILGLGLIYALCAAEWTVGRLTGLPALYGFGAGLVFAAGTMIASLETGRAEFAAGQGAVAQARVFGGALGLALCTVVFNTYVQADAGLTAGLSADQLDSLHRSPMAILGMIAAAGGGGVAQKTVDEAKTVYMKAFAGQLLVMLGAAGLGVLASLATWQSKPPEIIACMQGHKEDGAGAVPPPSRSGETTEFDGPRSDMDIPLIRRR